MKQFLIFALGCCMVFSSCKKAATQDDGNCTSTINSGILAATSATPTVAVNQEINFDVLYGIANGCGVSSEMESMKEGNTTTIKMMTKFVGCVCTQIYSEGRKTYIFKSPVVGNFKLKFSKGDNTFIEKDIIVQ